MRSSVHKTRRGPSKPVVLVEGYDPRFIAASGGRENDGVLASAARIFGESTQKPRSDAARPMLFIDQQPCDVRALPVRRYVVTVNVGPGLGVVVPHQPPENPAVSIHGYDTLIPHDTVGADGPLRLLLEQRVDSKDIDRPCRDYVNSVSNGAQTNPRLSRLILGRRSHRSLMAVSGRVPFLSRGRTLSGHEGLPLTHQPGRPTSWMDSPESRQAHRTQASERT